MKKNKAFTFVELLLVLMILGVIMALTIPIIKNLKDDDDIYRAYMKKANQDVTDAMNMIFIKEPNFHGFSKLELYDAFQPPAHIANANSKMNVRMRNAFNRALNAMECMHCTSTSTPKLKCETDEKCIDKTFAGYDGNNIQNNEGLYIGGKPVMLFQWVGNKNLSDNSGEKIYGYLYMDMNKDKKPNEMCKDRYRFIVYDDRVIMDTRHFDDAGDPAGGCTFDVK